MKEGLIETSEIPLISDGSQKSKIFDEAKTLNLKAGEKYSFCKCGKSKNLPYCDDSHRKLNKEKRTSYKSLKIIPKSDAEIAVYCSNWDSKSS